MHSQSSMEKKSESLRHDDMIVFLKIYLEPKKIIDGEIQKGQDLSSGT